MDDLSVEEFIEEIIEGAIETILKDKSLSSEKLCKLWRIINEKSCKLLQISSYKEEKEKNSLYHDLQLALGKYQAPVLYKDHTEFPTFKNFRGSLMYGDLDYVFIYNIVRRIKNIIINTSLEEYNLGNYDKEITRLIENTFFKYVEYVKDK